MVALKRRHVYSWNKFKNNIKKMRELKPNYLLILIWSFRKEVIKQEFSYLKNGGQLVFHLPRFHIVNYKNYKFYLKNDFKKLSYGF